MTFQPEQRVRVTHYEKESLNGMLGTVRSIQPAPAPYPIEVQLDGDGFFTPFAEVELEALSTEEFVGLHLYEIYYEEADGNDPKRFLGTLNADTQSQALERGTLRYGYPDHDLLTVQVVAQQS